MCLLIETIKVFNGKLFNINFHNQRLNKTRKDLFKSKSNFDINEIVEIPENIKNGLYKCRILYNQNIQKIEFLPYHKKNIKTLKIVNSNTIDYTYKYQNRKFINDLFEKKCNCDDILIIKNSMVTDTSFCNIIFYDGQKWVTPSKPLLKGTKREKYLKENLIIESDVFLHDIKIFTKAMLINAFFDFDQKNVISINNIIF